MQWQIGRELRARNYAAAAECFGHYVYGGGRVIQGLVNRRAAERKLFLTAAPSPEPDPYALFADAVFRFSRRSLANIPPVLETFAGDELGLNERATVHEHDRLIHDPGQNKAAIHKHKLWLLVLRKRVWFVAHNPLGKDGRPTWGVAKRGARWQALYHRTRRMD